MGWRPTSWSSRTLRASCLGRPATTNGCGRCSAPSICRRTTARLRRTAACDTSRATLRRTLTMTTDPQPASVYDLAHDEEPENLATFAVLVDNEPGVLHRLVGL